jgi:beta-glucosidase/6-phospho-beta-glucosidase/beta-galactosidase
VRKTEACLGDLAPGLPSSCDIERPGYRWYAQKNQKPSTLSATPFATLYHWETFLRRSRTSTAAGCRRARRKAFADYAGYIAESLGDRVTHFFTINEFRSFVEVGYQGRPRCGKVGRHQATRCSKRH